MSTRCTMLQRLFMTVGKIRRCRCHRRKRVWPPKTAFRCDSEQNFLEKNLNFFKYFDVLEINPLAACSVFVYYFSLFFNIKSVAHWSDRIVDAMTLWPTIIALGYFCAAFWVFVLDFYAKISVNQPLKLGSWRVNPWQVESVKIVTVCVCVFLYY